MKQHWRARGVSHPGPAAGPSTTRDTPRVRDVRSCGIRRLHRDQRGAMSLVSVVALLMLTMILGMVMNSARHVDQKVKMQNAADAATWTGGVVIARGMNSLAFTNHLLSDVFALTAFMREAHARSSDSLAAEILDNWERIGPFMSTSEYPP